MSAPASGRRQGPLDGLGPATKWCLVAGIAHPSTPFPTPEQLEDEAALILREGLAPVAVHALEERPDPTSVRGGFRRTAFEAEMRSMAADVAGAKVLAELADAGIPVAVVKGPAVARRHPKGWPRPYADIDVVVSRREFEAAIACSERLGFAYSERAVPQWRWFDTVCREGINLHADAGGNIDFHHHLPPWAFGIRLPAEDVIGRAEQGAICGVTVPFASPEDLLVVAALHALNDLWKGKLGLSSWRDVLVLTTELGEARARGAFARADLAWLYDLMAVELHRAVPRAGIGADAASAGAAVPFRARLRLDAIGWSGSTAATRHRLSWATRLPLPRAAAFLAGTAVPSPSYVKARHGSYRRYWSRSVRETVSTARGSDFRMTTVDDESVD
jgi:Uncharacterised nucleotidyltransferase